MVFLDVNQGHATMEAESGKQAKGLTVPRWNSNTAEHFISPHGAY
jgi:hypothetical protein